MIFDMLQIYAQSFVLSLDIERILILFSSSFSLVFFIGLQSQFIIKKESMPCFIAALVVGVLQMVVYKLAPNANLSESISYILGGALGLVSSIYIHTKWDNFIKK